MECVFCCGLPQGESLHMSFKENFQQREKINTSYLMIPNSRGIRYLCVCAAHVRALQAPLYLLLLQPNCGWRRPELRVGAIGIKPDTNLRQYCWFNPEWSNRQLMEIQETAWQADSIVNLVEAAKYFRNLNNPVSEPTGIQSRSQELSQKDERGRLFGFTESWRLPVHCHVFASWS